MERKSAAKKNVYVPVDEVVCFSIPSNPAVEKFE
jgi:hypothetical protein